MGAETDHGAISSAIDLASFYRRCNTGEGTEVKIMRRLFSWSFLSLLLVGMSACSSTPQQIYSRSNLRPGYALVVIGVAHDLVEPFGYFEIYLDEYSADDRNLKSKRFAFEERTRGPPESASVSYFVYRVPEGSYTAELGANAQNFVAPGGQAVYIGDFARVRDTGAVELRSDLPAAQNAVAPLLPSNLTLVSAQ